VCRGCGLSVQCTDCKNTVPQGRLQPAFSDSDFTSAECMHLKRMVVPSVYASAPHLHSSPQLVEPTFCMLLWVCHECLQPVKMSFLSWHWLKPIPVQLDIPLQILTVQLLTTATNQIMFWLSCHMILSKVEAVSRYSMHRNTKGEVVFHVLVKVLDDCQKAELMLFTPLCVTWFCQQCHNLEIVSYFWKGKFLQVSESENCSSVCLSPLSSKNSNFIIHSFRP
jgi:uncharacterized membrane protein YvlD (DUF360 family)